MKRFLFIFFLVTIAANQSIVCQTIQEIISLKNTVEWYPAQLLKEKNKEIQILGSPQEVSSPFGKAVFFDGVDDAILLNEMPLKKLVEFTIEMIFRPDSGNFEQRFLHIGEPSADRILLELRSVNDKWYFDGFAASGKNKKALIDEELVHPTSQWHHVAFIVEPNQLSTYVNGTLELTEPFSFNPIKKGASSIGTRLDKRSWFKGSIYQIKISSTVLQPSEFMQNQF